MSKGAVRIDLSTFFDDERKMACILIDNNWKSVSCLQKRVQVLFDVDSVRFLSDGCFLPPQESIEIIKFCNDIKAFVPRESLEKRKKKKIKNIKEPSEDTANNEETPINQCYQEYLETSQKKRKISSLQVNNFSNKAKRSKNGNKELNKVKNPFEETELQLLQVQENETKSSEFNKETHLSNEGNVRDELCDTKSKKAEKALISDDQCYSSTPNERKKSTKHENINDNMKVIALDAFSVPSSECLIESRMLKQSENPDSLSNFSNPNNPFKTPKYKAHIYFDESGGIVSRQTKKNAKSTPKNDKESKTIVIFRSPLNDVTNGMQTQKPRIFNLKLTNIPNAPGKKKFVEIQEEIILLPHIMQKSMNEITLTNEKTFVPGEDVRTENNTKAKKSEQSLSFNDKSYVSNTIATDATAISKNINAEEVNPDDLEKSHIKERNATELKNESQIKQADIDKTSVTVDCVDLSIDPDEDIIEVEKNETTEKEFENLAAGYNSRKLSESEVEEISEIIDLNETEDNANTTSLNNLTQHNKSAKNIRVETILPLSTDLLDLPDKEDIVIFKVQYTSKNKLVNTNFIAGKVEYINRRTKSIKILIIDGFSELSHIPSRLICNLDDSRNFDNYLQLKLNDMCEAKLFSMSLVM